MAKHVINKGNIATVDVTEGNSEWLVEKGVTLSGAPALQNDGFDDVDFVIDGKLVTTGDGLYSIGTADMDAADNTSVIVGASGRIVAGFDGIQIEGDSASVENRGLVQAENTAILVYGDDLKIENAGKVISDGNYAVGIIGGDNFSIRNDGLMRGADMGAAIVTMSGYGTLVNGEDGVIDGYLSFWSNSDDTTVINRGKITSQATTVMLGAGADRLVNRGEIDGGISLGAGDDLADLSKGILTNSVVEGGDGNDMFYVDRTDIDIVELSGGGIDLILTTVSYTLGNLDTDDIETLAAKGKKSIDLAGNDLNNTLAGNVGNNAISGGDGDDLLLGLRGNDILTGGDGTDHFNFYKKGGVDTITDFTLDEDVIRILGIPGIEDFADLKARMTDADFGNDDIADTIIDLGGGNKIRLVGIDRGTLDADDFSILT